MSDQYRICAGATLGALVGAGAAYLFFTDDGRAVRDRIEPAIDEAMAEFSKFRRTIEKIGAMASEGLRALNEFQTARTQPPYPGTGLSH